MHLPILNFRLPFIRIENTQLAPSENRSHKSADGRVATEAAWLNGKMEEITERAEKTLDRDRPSHGRSWRCEWTSKSRSCSTRRVRKRLRRRLLALTKSGIRHLYSRFTMLPKLARWPRKFCSSASIRLRAAFFPLS